MMALLVAVVGLAHVAWLVITHVISSLFEHDVVVYVEPEVMSVPFLNHW
jgi:uncharacterized protein YrrD